jgi:hypothetical protein
MSKMSFKTFNIFFPRDLWANPAVPLKLGWPWARGGNHGISGPIGPLLQSRVSVPRLGTFHTWNTT